MNLSEIYYEAACRTSNVPPDEYTISSYEFSCCAVAEVENMGRDYTTSDAALAYADLMSVDGGLLPSDVEDAADRIDWSYQDYRTFMLLMASEAVK